MIMYFPRYLIASTMTMCFNVVMKLLGMHMPMKLIFSCAKGATYMTFTYKLSILYKRKLKKAEKLDSFQLLSL